MNRRGTPSAFVISITPFDETGEIDWDATRAHFRRLRESGIGVYVGGGGSGEGHTLLPHEVDALLALAVDELLGSVPTRAMGVEPRTAKQMIEFGRRVKDTGLDAMQVYSLDMGHLGIPRPQELDRYFRDVLEQVEMPSVISTHFSVGYMVPVDLLCTLCDEYPSVIGVNCSIGQDFTYLVRLLDELPGHVEVHVGGPMHALSALAMGGTGFLSSEANLVPKLANSVVTHYGVGDYAAAADAYAKVVQVFTLLSSRVAVKALLKAFGLPGGEPRLPRMLLTSEDDAREAVAALRRIGIPELP
ncbi:MAG: dihydrodipicolinate synthase family protein [Acidimicrobiia bacterium]